MFPYLVFIGYNYIHIYIDVIGLATGYIQVSVIYDVIMTIIDLT
jgi:hypothetical protein